MREEEAVERLIGLFGWLQFSVHQSPVLQEGGNNPHSTSRKCLERQVVGDDDGGELQGSHDDLVEH